MENKKELYRIAELMDELLSGRFILEDTEKVEEAETLLDIVFNRQGGECGAP